VRVRLDDTGCPGAAAGFGARLRLVFANPVTAELAAEIQSPSF